MEEYFGYDVTLCMNITDIEDKIIKRCQEAQQPYDEFARYWEAAFHRDMEALGVLPPTVLTRVSEYVPEIIAYIERLISQGFAYASQGSVYFNIVSYRASHTYGKLEPSAIDNAERFAEGEGTLTDAFSSEKTNAGDFVLWKKSKEGEPSWESPWGAGRPGWHIECSVMAGEVLPCPIDIHSGGVDLKYPHHENELAQSEAYNGVQQWVNYFLHTGHLHIEGLKMSRSLKNFNTIQEILAVYSSRQIRVSILLANWDQPMNFDYQNLTEAAAREHTFKEFLLNLQAELRSSPIERPQKWSDREKQLNKSFEATQKTVHEALCDNFNTPVVLDALTDFIRLTNTQLTEGPLPRPLLVTALRYFTRILGCLGLDYSEHNATDLRTPLLNSFCEFRDEVREAARRQDSQAILLSCDKLRDDTLPVLGVRLEDRSGKPSVWKLEDPQELQKEIARKKQEEVKSSEKKEQAAKLRASKEAEKAAKARVKAEEMFLSQVELYSAFDDKGIPTHDKTGEPLTKSARKKLTKDWEKQKKLNEQALKQAS
jgi:cysteinyl-tRNA synthetase